MLNLSVAVVILAHVLPALAGRLVATVLTVCHMLMAFVQTGHVFSCR